MNLSRNGRNPRPTGLGQADWPTPAPFSQFDSLEMALSKISSQDQVFNTIAIKQDRKAQTKSIWVHNSVTNYLTKTQLT